MQNNQAVGLRISLAYHSPFHDHACLVLLPRVHLARARASQSHFVLQNSVLSAPTALAMDGRTMEKHAFFVPRKLLIVNVAVLQAS